MNRQKGFSLFELVMVMTLTAILAAVAIPRFSGFTAYSLSNNAQDLLTALRYAQHQSMTHSGADPFQVIVNNGFSVTQSGAAITHPLTGGLGYTSDNDIWSGVTITSGTIAFDAVGRPTCSAGLAPCSLPSDGNAVFTLSKDGSTQTVTLERYTGYARIN